MFIYGLTKIVMTKHFIKIEFLLSPTFLIQYEVPDLYKNKGPIRLITLINS